DELLIIVVLLVISYPAY
ncbi:type I toxin-antitoxin system Ibs family toxin, partial [Escherichia coli]|nr:type I toxin-antitoxin system Ibs family toxin [Escherichia coli]